LTVARSSVAFAPAASRKKTKKKKQESAKPPRGGQLTRRPAVTRPRPTARPNGFARGFRRLSQIKGGFFVFVAVASRADYFFLFFFSV
jgi:hypothetical protein